MVSSTARIPVGWLEKKRGEDAIKAAFGEKGAGLLSLTCRSPQVTRPEHPVPGSDAEER
jgi:hypothetical protein